jgi:hypothetical protein
MHFPPQLIAACRQHSQFITSGQLSGGSEDASDRAAGNPRNRPVRHARRGANEPASTTMARMMKMKRSATMSGSRTRAEAAPALSADDAWRRRRHEHRMRYARLLEMP